MSRDFEGRLAEQITKVLLKVKLHLESRLGVVCCDTVSKDGIAGGGLWPPEGQALVAAQHICIQHCFGISC